MTEETSSTMLPYATHPSQTNAGQWAALLLKILAIYFMVLGFPIVFTPLYLIGAARWDYFLVSISPYVVYAAAAVLLFWRADRWGPRLLPAGSSVEMGVKINSADAQAIGFSILGVYLIATGAPNLLAMGLHAMTDPNFRGYPTSERLRNFTVPLVQVVAGLVLFLRARGLALLWHKIRSSGRYEDRMNGTNSSE